MQHKTYPINSNYMHKPNGLTRFKRLVPVLGSIVVALALFIVLNSKNVAFAGCGGDDKASFNNAGELNCGDEEYRYDPVASSFAGMPVFVENSGDYIAINQQGQAILRSCENGPGNPCLTRNTDPFRPGGDDIGLEDYQNATEELNGTDGSGTDGGPFCSIVRPTDCWPWAGNKYDNFSGNRCDGTPNGDNKPCRYTGPAPPNLGRLRQALEDAADREEASEECETTISNPLSFILCPIRDALVDAFGNVIDYLTRLLENPNLSSNDNLPNAIRSMITLANSFYILIFLFIIFANFVAIPGLDNYTIKKTLPKLIAAIILTQFSLLICQVVLDLGNILAVTLPSQLLSAFGISGTPGQAFADVVVPSAEGNFFQNLGQFIIMILVLLVGLIVGLIAFFYLIARYLFIILLVLTLPLAFAAWVLPNTEQYFKKWWELFIRLSLMFLLISLLFAGGAIFSNLLTSGDLFGTGASGFLTQLIALCVPLVVLLLVPKTLKLSGAIMSKSKEAAAKGFGNAKDSYAGKKISKSAQEGKLAEAKGQKYEDFGKSNFAKKTLGHDRAALIQAKGSAKKDVVSDKIAKSIDTLDFDDQLKILRDTGGKGKAGEAAKRAIGKKQDEILNKRNLNNGDIVKLEKLKRDGHFDDNGKLALARATLPEGSNGYINNPFLPDSPGGGTGTSTPTSSTTPLPPSSSSSGTSSSGGGFPTSGGSSSGGSSSGGRGSTTAPTPPPTPSSPSARWRAATPIPSSTGGPSVIPGTGGAVDLSDLGGDAKTGPDGRSTVPPPPDSTPTPPEPPPTTE